MGKKYTIEDMKALAKRHRGRCLSCRYTNSHEKLHWECARKHQWKAKAYQVVQGSWCPACAIIKRAKAQRYSVEDMHRVAKKLGGKFISKHYRGARKKHKWQCSHNHIFNAQPDSVMQGHWCPVCAGRIKHSIANIKSIAAERGGKCLSRSYAGRKYELTWSCSYGHRFEMDPDSVLRGSWCPKCATGLGERIVRSFFEQIFGEEFPRTRPEWLKKRSGKPLELDGYSEKLGFAFEHQGKQHYMPVSFMKRDDLRLKEIRNNDKFKMAACRKHGVRLFVIPEVPALTTVEEIKGKIREQAKHLKVKLPRGFANINVSPRDAYVRKDLLMLQRIAMGRGGRLLSKDYYGMIHKYLWQCKNGHKWEASAHSVKKGAWCKICAGKQQHTILLFQKLAKAHGGKCLSTEYQSRKSLLKFECAKGHTFELRAGSVLRNFWCKRCSRREKGSLEEMKAIARDRGGDCLSKIYVNRHTRMLFVCKEGHRWKAKALSVVRGSWCRKCSYQRRRST